VNRLLHRITASSRALRGGPMEERGKQSLPPFVESAALLHSNLTESETA
jgi:hypothetical protein